MPKQPHQDLPKHFDVHLASKRQACTVACNKGLIFGSGYACHPPRQLGTSLQALQCRLHYVAHVCLRSNHFSEDLPALAGMILVAQPFIDKGCRGAAGTRAQIPLWWFACILSVFDGTPRAIMNDHEASRNYRSEPRSMLATFWSTLRRMRKMHLSPQS